MSTGTDPLFAKKCCISRPIVYMAGIALCGSDVADLENFTFFVDT